MKSRVELILLALWTLIALVFAGTTMTASSVSSEYRLNTYLLFVALLKTGISSAVFQDSGELEFPMKLTELVPRMSSVDGQFTYIVSSDKRHFFLRCPISTVKMPLYALASEQGITCSPCKIKPALPFHIKATLRDSEFLEFPRSRKKYLLKKFGKFTVVGVMDMDGSFIHRHPVILNPSPFHEDLIVRAKLYCDYQLSRREVDEIIADFNVTDPRVIADLRASSR